MRHAARLVAVGAVVGGMLAGATPARAQDATLRGLVGISSVSIIVEQLEDDAVRCNVSESGIDAAIRLPLDASRLRIEPNTTPYVYARVNVLPLASGLCVASIDVSLKRILAIPATNQLVFGAMVWERGSLATGPASNFGQRVNQTVGDYTKQLIAAWIQANPR